MISIDIKKKFVKESRNNDAEILMKELGSEAINNSPKILFFLQKCENFDVIESGSLIE